MYRQDYENLYLSRGNRDQGAFLLISYPVVLNIDLNKGHRVSKFFFKGRIEKREDYEGRGFNTKRAEKLGTEKFPLTLTVETEERKAEIEAILKEHSLYGKY